MAKTIDTKFEVGDWARCSEGRGWPQYINITKENVLNYNDSHMIEKYSLEKVSDEVELKSAQDYLIETISLRAGDYLRFNGGKKQVVDRIESLPEIKGDLFSIDSYISEGYGRFHTVRTETGYEVKYFDAVENKISEKEAQKFLHSQIENLRKDLEIFEHQSKELEIRKFF
jgi:hypothetical protein